MGTVFGAVVAISDPAPRIRRLVFDVPSLPDLGLPGDGDDAVGIYFPEPGETAPPAMECRDGVWAYFDLDTAPHGRNYSIRTAGPGTRQITVDIVLHERGVASDFARSARACSIAASRIDTSCVSRSRSLLSASTAWSRRSSIDVNLS